MKRFLACCFLCLAAICSSSLSAGAPGEPIWQTLGPEGGYADFIVIDPSRSSTVYAAGRNGVYRSVDAGVSWNDISQGLGRRLIRGLQIDPSSPSTLYAAVDGDGIFKSIDAGQSWSPSNQGLATLYVNALAVDPGNPRTLYAGTTFEGIFKSIDGGSTWSPANQGLTFDYTFIGLAVAPSDSMVIYAASLFSGVFKSVDAGASWVRIPQGGTFALTGALAVHPSNPNMVHAGAVDTVYRSLDGETWTSFGECNLNFSCTQLGNVRQLAIDPSEPSRVFAATSLGGWVSEDSGAAWERIAALPGDRDAYSLAIDPQSGQRLYFGIWDGLAKSVNSGASWRISSQGLRLLPAFSVDVDPINPNTIWVGAENGLYRKVSGQRSWRQVRGNERFGPSELLISRSDAMRMYYSDSRGARFSINGGRSWGSVGFPLSDGIGLFRSDPSDPLRIYAPQSFVSPVFNLGIARSDDGGATWVEFVSPESRTVIDLAIAPQGGARLFALLTDRLYQGDDSGQAWELISADLEEERFHAVGLCAGRLYLASESGQVFSRPSEGGQWESRSQGLPGSSLRALACDPLRPEVLYVGTWGRGVYWSQDRGLSWMPLGAGLESPFVISLRVFEEAPEQLLASTFGGLSKLELSPPAAGFELTLESDSEFRVGHEIEYGIVLTNGSGSDLADGSGFEIVNSLDPGLELSGAQADRGTVSYPSSPNAVAWDGEIPAGESVRLRVRARILPDFDASSISNQARAQLDLNGDGSNESWLLSDDPSQPGPSDPHAATVEPSTILSDVLAVPNSLDIEATFVGVAAANAENGPSSDVRVQGLDSQGGLLSDEIVEESLGAGAQRAFNSFEVAPDEAAVVTVSGDPRPLDGFFLLGDFPLQRLDGIGGEPVDAQTLYITQARQSSQAQTLLFVFNPSPSESAEVEVQLFTKAGELASSSDVSLAPLGSVRAGLDQLGLAQQSIEDGYLRLQASQPFRAFALFHNDRSFWTAAGRPPAVRRNLTAPHFFVSGEDTTRLRLLNPLQSDAQIRILLTDDAQGMIAERNVALAGGTLEAVDLSQLLEARPGEAFSGFLQIESRGSSSQRWPSQAGLLATVEYDFASVGTRSSLPIEPPRCSLRCESRFLQVANDPAAGIFQGLAVANSSAQFSTVSVEVFDRDGASIARGFFGLLPATRFVALFDEIDWFFSREGEGPIRQSGGWMQVSATTDISVFTLLGGPNFLASVQGR